MSFKSVARLTIALLLVTILSGVVPTSNAQDRRPRYTQRQNSDRSWTVPDDTVIPVSMNGSLGSKSSRVGDRFTATVTAPIQINGREVIPAGAIIEGHVAQVTPARRMGKAGAVAVDFDDLVFPNGSRVKLNGNLTSDDPEVRRRIDDENRVSGEENGRSAVFVGSSGAIGAVLGGILGGAKGAVMGGVLGAGAGAASVLFSKGEEVNVPSGSPFGIQLRQPLLIREEFLGDGQNNTNTIDPDPPARQPDNQPQNDPSPPATAQPDKAQPIPSNEPEPSEPVNSSPPSAPPVSLPLSSPEMLRRAQVALKEQGYYEGEADGMMTPRVTAALKTYQRENKLPETGELDAQTAQKLGILSNAAPSDRPDRQPSRPSPAPREKSASPDAVLANVISANANRTPEGAIHVLIETQANTGGWRWYGDSVVNGDTLEVYARAVRPTGMVTQVLTRGRIELTVKDRVEYVTRVVVHSSGNDRQISISPQPAQQPVSQTQPPAATTTPAGRSTTYADSASVLQRQAEELLNEFQRVSGVRYNGTTFEVDNRSRNKDADIELLFAIDNFVSASQLYTRMVNSLQDRQSLRSATLAMAREARRTDRVISTSASQSADKIAPQWDAIRQEVLRLMQAFNISTSELEN